MAFSDYEKRVADRRVADGYRSPKGFQRIADLSSAVGLTVPAGATTALIQVTGANVRWRDDGTSPTTTVGMQLADGLQLSYFGNLGAIELIEEAASAVANISYYSV